MSSSAVPPGEAGNTALSADALMQAKALGVNISTMPRRKLPIGIQNLREIRTDNHYYVDKSGIAVDLIEQGKYYFLSRPRRFGKSLFLDTLKELFEGNAALFQGLAAEQRWDWSIRYPVLKISFGGGVVANRAQLDRHIHGQLFGLEERFGLPRRFDDNPNRWHDLILRASELSGQPVVILVDEYDKPILDRIDQPELAVEIREGLKDIYSVIKDSDAYIKFAFLTGVSKFSKVSLFSGLNNLKDITLDARYSTICGYTDHDVDSVFAPELAGLDRAQIRAWYNGYNWLGESVYNPFDILLLFDNRQFRPYWFETGTPTFLVKLLTERHQFTPDLERLMAPETLLSTFDVDNIPTEAILFQAGYLTVDQVRYIPGRMELSLRYPNLEVKASLNDSLLQTLSGNPSVPARRIGRLYDVLTANDLPALRELFQAFYAGIPYAWCSNNLIAQYEGYYASVFYSYFAALGLDTTVEDSTNQGRIDLTLRFQGRVYLFEFKVVEREAEGKAMAQIKANGYADKYRARGEPIYLIGVEFSRASRNIVSFEVELADQAVG